MDLSAATEDDSFNLTAQLDAAYKKRKRLWQDFFDNFEKLDTENSPTLSLTELLDENNYSEMLDPMNYSNKVNETDLNRQEKKLVNTVQSELKSNLNRITLWREKAKLLSKADEIKKSTSQLKAEIRRLRKYLPPDQIKAYVGLCVRPNRDMEHLIEKVLLSDIKTTLVYKVAADLDGIEHKFVHAKLLKEWDYLTRTLPEENVVIYAVNVVRKSYS